VHEWSHQLVVQFPDEAFGDFDGVVAFGDALERALGDDHEVDGHDIGLGEVNYFVLTRDPGTALSSIVDALGDVLSKRAARVGTRAFTADAYDCVWPVGDTRPFVVR